MTLDEIKRSLVVGLWLRGELAQALNVAGVSYPAYLQTETQVQELQAALAAMPAAVAPKGAGKGQAPVDPRT